MKLKVVRREPSQEHLQRLSHLQPVLARAYAARGIEDPLQLTHTLDRLLPVGTLAGIEAAVELLLAHRDRGERVLVVGDFDADGDVDLLAAVGGGLITALVSAARMFQLRRAAKKNLQFALKR
jgi:hypothetical protein